MAETADPQGRGGNRFGFLRSPRGESLLLTVSAADIFGRSLRALMPYCAALKSSVLWLLERRQERMYELT
jgi:hypothetical protein